MLRAFAAVGMGLVAVVSFGQSSSPQAKFEAADVHLTPRSTSSAMRTMQRGGRYELQNATMVDLVRSAYGMDAEDVSGGPNWVEFDRFEVIAKTPSDASPETLKPMLQSLLAERFNLKVHNETKSMPTFVLTQGKGKHKLKEAEAPGKTGCDTQPLAMRIVDGRISAQTNLSCHNMTMEAFAADLRRLGAGYITTSVIDSTELKGSWDFDLKFTPKSIAPLTGENAGIFDAIDKQLGLKLEEKTVPRPVLVIDQVNRKPTENSLDVAKKLPALPAAEFEAGTIKPVDPSARLTAIGGSFGVQPGGRVNLPPLSLRSLISLAWGPSVSTDEIVGAPKWVDSARFEIVAKAPPEYVAANGPAASLQDMGPMMQALITEQFKMKAHLEERPVTAYTLVAAKPKLKKADPSTRTGCKPANSGGLISLTGSAPLPSIQLTCQNITMAQFVDQLQILASGYVRHPVVEATGLEGAWDFSFSYSAINPAQLANLRIALPVGAAGAPADAPGASDPIGGTSLFDAVEKQLGLKLEQQKRPYPVLVIESIEPIDGQVNGPALPILVR